MITYGRNPTNNALTPLSPQVIIYGSPPAYCLLPTAYCPPPTAHRLLPTAYYQPFEAVTFCCLNDVVEGFAR
jgi:hypothetical protein